MKLQKIFICILLIVPTITNVKGQNFSLPNPHFFNNRYALNPSLAGSMGYPYITLNYRKQSIGGLPGTPYQAFIGADLPFQHRRHNIGIQAYTRKAGLFQNSFFVAHYALQLMPSPNQRLRLGFGGGLKFTMLDTKMIDASDPVIQSWSNKTAPLLQAAISYNTGNFWIGGTLTDVLYKEPRDFEQAAQTNAFKNYNAFVSYKFIVSEDLFVETSLLSRSKEYTTSSVEVNVMGMLYDQYWGALSYRTDIGATIMAGFKFSGFLSTALGYKASDFFSKKAGTSVNNSALDVLLGFHLGNAETAKEEWVEKEEKPTPKTPKKADTAQKTPEQPKKDTSTKDTSGHAAVRKIIKGNEPNDLNYDHYVVVGTFSNENNARIYSEKVSKEMNLDVKLGYNSIKKVYYVYIFKSSEYDPALKIYEQYRGSNQFGDIWILKIVKE